jgi:uroporphyrinogen-III decarboxylase
MANMTPRERVLAALDRKKLDRPPVVCFTQIATVDAMDLVKVYWPWRLPRTSYSGLNAQDYPSA